MSSQNSGMDNSDIKDDQREAVESQEDEPKAQLITDSTKGPKKTCKAKLRFETWAEQPTKVKIFIYDMCTALLPALLLVFAALDLEKPVAAGWWTAVFPDFSSADRVLAWGTSIALYLAVIIFMTTIKYHAEIEVENRKGFKSRVCSGFFVAIVVVYGNAFLDSSVTMNETQGMVAKLGGALISVLVVRIFFSLPTEYRQQAKESEHVLLEIHEAIVVLSAFLTLCFALSLFIAISVYP